MDPAKLKELKIFSSLNKKELAELGRLTDEVDVEAGTRLADQGTLAYEFFIIENGTADVTRDGDAVAELGPGDFFGASGLVKSARRAASVVAATPMRLIVLDGREFRTMMTDIPEVGEKISLAVEELRQTLG